MELEKKFLYQLLDSVQVARLALINRKNLPEAMPIVFARQRYYFQPSGWKAQAVIKSGKNQKY